jgi:hypothetical protein
MFKKLTLQKIIVLIVYKVKFSILSKFIICLLSPLCSHISFIPESQSITLETWRTVLETWRLSLNTWIHFVLKVSPGIILDLRGLNWKYGGACILGPCRLILAPWGLLLEKWRLTLESLMLNLQSGRPSQDLWTPTLTCGRFLVL